LASALAAVNFVASKTNDPKVVPNEQQRLQVQSDVKVIDSSLTFVNELLRNMLDLHRTSKGLGIQLHCSPTDVLLDVLQPISSILFMRGTSVDILTECTPEHLYVLTDRMRVKQILLNLAFNATKFVTKGYIRLKAGVDKDDSNKVTFYVEDSGPG
jgi:signal transduction histidine kinase